MQRLSLLQSVMHSVMKTLADIYCGGRPRKAPH